MAFLRITWFPLPLYFFVCSLWTLKGFLVASELATNILVNMGASVPQLTPPKTVHHLRVFVVRELATKRLVVRGHLCHSVTQVTVLNPRIFVASELATEILVHKGASVPQLIPKKRPTTSEFSWRGSSPRNVW